MTYVPGTIMNTIHCATVLLSFGVVTAAPYVSSQFSRPDPYPLQHQTGSKLFPTHGHPSQQDHQHHFAEKFPFDPSSSVLWGGGVVAQQRQPSVVFPDSGNRRPSRQGNFPTFVEDGGGDAPFIFPDDPPPVRPVVGPTTTRRPTTTGRPTTPTADSSTTVANCGCPSTPEYNPVCGTNAVTYSNPGKLKCANICGLVIQLQHYGPCVATTVAPSSTTPRS